MSHKAKKKANSKQPLKNLVSQNVGQKSSNVSEAMKKKMADQVRGKFMHTAEVQKAMKQDKDSNGMNAFHRAATEHNLLLLKEMFEIDPQIRDDLTMWINSESNYGETPLLISAMLKHKGESQGLNVEREKFIDYLLEHDAQVNTCNRYSLWTPAHWAARLGDDVLLTKLINKGAMPFTPDSKGYFPIDYAGKFENFSTVKILVEVSLEKFDLLKRHQQHKSNEPNPFEL